MKIDLRQKKVLVTGGTRGIGEAIALLFIECNAQVIITGKTKDGRDYKNIDFRPVDFTNRRALNQFANEIKDEGIDVLVNNAGINKIDLAQNVDMNDWDNLNDVNLRAPMILSQAVIPHMVNNNWGRIINVGSIFGVVSKSKRISYSTTKFGLIGQTKALALDLAKNNILVNLISPGFIDTELTRKVLSAPELTDLISTVPMERLGRVEEIAKAALFLASDLNSFTTGQNIVVDGGFTSG